MFETFYIFQAALINSIHRYIACNDFNCDLPFPSLPTDTQAAMQAMYRVYIEKYACNHTDFGDKLDKFVRSFENQFPVGTIGQALYHAADIVARLSRIRSAAGDDNMGLIDALNKIQNDCAAAGAAARNREAESILAQEKINRAKNYIIGLTDPLRVSIADRALAVDFNVHFTQLPRATQVAMTTMYRCLVSGFVGDYNSFSVAMDEHLRTLSEYRNLPLAAEKEKALNYLASMLTKLNGYRRALTDESDINNDNLGTILEKIYSQNIPVASVVNKALKYTPPAYFDLPFANALKNSIQDCLRYPVNFNNHRTQIPRNTLAAMTVMYPIFIQKYRGEAEFFCGAIDQYIKHMHRYLDLLDNYSLQVALTHFVGMIQKMQVYRRCVQDDNCVDLAVVFSRIPQDHLDIEAILNQPNTNMQEALDVIKYHFRINKRDAIIDAAAQYAAAHAELNELAIQLEKENHDLNADVVIIAKNFQENGEMIALALDACASGDLQPIQKLRNLNKQDVWDWFVNGQALTLATAHKQEKVVAYLLANNVQYAAHKQVSQPEQWVAVKENIDELDGWSCFDVAAGITRDEIVEYAVQHSANEDYRKLLAPEIKMALVDVLRYIQLDKIVDVNERNEERAKFEDSVVRLAENMFPANKVKERAELENIIGEGVYFKPEHIEHKYVEAIDQYCSSRTIYLKYVKQYYDNKYYNEDNDQIEGEWFAMAGGGIGESPTSMLDIVARKLNKKIVIHNAGNISETAFAGADELHIRYNGNHFVRLKKVAAPANNPNPVQEMPAEALPDAQDFNDNFKALLKEHIALHLATYKKVSDQTIQQNIDNIKQGYAESVEQLQKQRAMLDEQYPLHLELLEVNYRINTEAALALRKGEFEREADFYRTAKAVAENKMRAALKDAIERAERELRAAKSRAKRKKTQLLIALPVIAISAAYVGPLAGNIFAAAIGASATATTTIGLVATGVIGGGLSGAITDGKVLKGAIEGGLLAFAGQQINVAVAGFDRFTRVAIQGATLCTIKTVMHGGNLVNNVTFSIGAAIISEAFVPVSNLAEKQILTQGEMLQLMFENTKRAVVTAVPSVVLGKEDMPSVMSNAFGVAGSVFAGNEGRKAASRVEPPSEPQWLGANQRLPTTEEAAPIANIKAKANVKSEKKATPKVTPKQGKTVYAKPNKPNQQHDVNPDEQGGLPAYLKKPTGNIRNQNKQRAAPEIPKATADATNIKSSKHSERGTFKVLCSAITGDATAKQEMRNRLPNIASASDGVVKKTLTPKELTQTIQSGVKDGLHEVGTLIGEEVARLTLGEETKTAAVFKSAGKFVGEEAARLSLGEQTKVSQFVHKAGTFIGEDVARLSLGEKTTTGDAFGQVLKYVDATPSKQILHSFVKEGTKVVVMGNLGRVYAVAKQLPPKAYNITTMGVRKGVATNAVVDALNLGNVPVTGGKSAAALVGEAVVSRTKYEPINLSSNAGNGIADTFKIERIVQNTERTLLHQFNKNFNSTIQSPNSVAMYAQGNSANLAKNNLLFSKQAKIDFAPTGFKDAQLYPAEKIPLLGEYLRKRGVDLYPVEYLPPGSRYPAFTASYTETGRPTVFLPRDATILEVKHELSHYLDFKNLGVDKYSKLSRLEKEQMVLDRLKDNRIWKQLTDKEVAHSEKYVADLKPKNILKNKKGVNNVEYE